VWKNRLKTREDFEKYHYRIFKQYITISVVNNYRTSV